MKDRNKIWSKDIETQLILSETYGIIWLLCNQMKFYSLDWIRYKIKSITEEISIEMHYFVFIRGEDGLNVNDFVLFNSSLM